MKKRAKYIGFVILSVCFAGYGWYRYDTPSVDSAQSYRANTEGRGPLEPRRLTAITELLDDLFGPPDSPRIPVIWNETAQNLVAQNLTMQDSATQGSTIQNKPTREQSPGSQRIFDVDCDVKSAQWYRQDCSRCHGRTGDGFGPLAARYAPYPRDFRHGIFKFTSTDAGLKPLRADLLRTISRGIPGTAMPSFAELPAERLAKLVEQVIFLSVRGESELLLMQQVFDAGLSEPERTETVDEIVTPVLLGWREAQTAGTVPVDRVAVETALRAASVERGRQIYLDPRSQCAACHGENGDGNGSEKEKVWDDWNIVKRSHNPERQAELDSLYRLPAQRLYPRDFRLGEYRGGAEPLDIFRRIAVGVKGTPMPMMHASGGVPAVLTDAEIADLVMYVRSYHTH